MAKVTYVREENLSFINNYMAKVIYAWERRTLGFINNYMAKVIYAWERRTLVLLIITWLRAPMSERGEP
jgi:hypothetical protein